MSSTSPSPSATKPWASVAAGDRDDVGLRLDVGARLDQPGRDVVLGEHLDHALGRAVPGVGDDDASAVGEPAA